MRLFAVEELPKDGRNPRQQRQQTEKPPQSEK
jgi:hypothetical protein